MRSSFCKSSIRASFFLSSLLDACQWRTTALWAGQKNGIPRKSLPAIFLTSSSVRPPPPSILSSAWPRGPGILSNAVSLIYNSVLCWHPRVEITHVDNGSTACSSRGKGHHLDAVALFPSLSNGVLTSRANPSQQVKTQQGCSIMKTPSCTLIMQYTVASHRCLLFVCSVWTNVGLPAVNFAPFIQTTHFLI